MVWRLLPIAIATVLLTSGCSDVDSPDSAEGVNAVPSGPTTEDQSASDDHNSTAAVEGMVLIPGGQFVMGSDRELSRMNERPSHSVEVSAFWMDVTPITNDQFAEFVEATDYVTIAERAPDWEELKKQLPAGTPKPDDSFLVPGVDGLCRIKRSG